jgi:two-component system, OmpR family, phosphate regulon sensor histidine kinase PhoR
MLTLYAVPMSNRPAAFSLQPPYFALAVLVAILCAAALSGAIGLGWPFAIGAAGLGFTAGWALRGGNAGRANSVAAVSADAAISLLDKDLRAVVELMVSPALIVDPEGRVLAHNVRAREHFTSIDNGQPLHRVSRQPGLLETAQRAREQGVTQTGEIAEITPGGGRLLATVSPLETLSSDTQKSLLLIQFRDLSEQDRLAQTRSDFIANASHELRTPLASLKGFIETLQGPASGDAAAHKRFLAIMETQAARMARILDDLLSLSRIEMQAHVTPQEEVDVGAVVTGAVQGLEPIAREAHITLHLHPIEHPYMTKGDSDELEQVFQNLIENALKYGKAGGIVEVSVTEGAPATRHSGSIVIAVSDDGPGIAEVHLPRLTERFYRADTAASRERGGTGLGLAIVKHILNRHRGELLITSTLGKGSTFTVVLDSLKDKVRA